MGTLLGGFVLPLLLLTGFLVTAEYLFQLWGKQAKMFPGQKYHDISLFLGLQVYKQSFEGLESGLRAKVLVIAACTLQYNVFRWLEKMPTILNVGRSENPSPLFLSAEGLSTAVSTSDGYNQTLSESRDMATQRIGQSSSCPSFRHGIHQSSQSSSSRRGSSTRAPRKYSFGYIWGTMNDSHQWNNKRIVALKQERFEMQKATLKVYLKFWMENMFKLFGLEINMIALLLASFALLNAISILYIACLASCVLLTRPIIHKLWPIFVFLFATILLAEYFELWKNTMPFNQHVSTETNVHCHDCRKNSNTYFHYCQNCWLGMNFLTL